MSTDNLHGVTPIDKTKVQNSKLDIIFIHGLNGHASKTWINGKDQFWPQWLQEDFEDICIWTIGYDATPSMWLSDTMPMEERALNILNDLSLTEGIGTRPIIFIVHSMGGLILKYLLEKSNGDDDYTSIIKQTKGVTFLATPHEGSGGANFLTNLSIIFRINDIVKQLQKNSSSLDRLDDVFNTIVRQRRLKCLSFYETKEVKIKNILTGWTGIKVVDKSSAKGRFNQPTPLPVDKNHLDICKLNSKKDLVYRNINSLIQNILETSNISSVDNTSSSQVKLRIYNLPSTNEQLFGREDELSFLDEAWENKQLNIINFIAMAGAGKTALINKWLDQMSEDNFRGANNIYAWSFHYQDNASSDMFFADALSWFGYTGKPIIDAREKGLKLAELINQRTLLIIDNLDTMQYPITAEKKGLLRDEGLKALLSQLAMQNNGLVIITSRQEIRELTNRPQKLILQYKLKELSQEAGIRIFKSSGVIGSHKELSEAVAEMQGHAMSLGLVSEYISEYENGDISKRNNSIGITNFPEDSLEVKRALSAIAAYEKQLQGTIQLQILYMVALFSRPAPKEEIEILRKKEIQQISDIVVDNKVFMSNIVKLRKQRLLSENNDYNSDTLDMHPLVREYFSKSLKEKYPKEWETAHYALYEYLTQIPKDFQPDTLNELMPLILSVEHGCKAGGIYGEIYDMIVGKRIMRGQEFYLCKKLGYFSESLSIYSHFCYKHPKYTFEVPVSNFSHWEQGVILGLKGFFLTALGKYREAVPLIKMAIKIFKSEKHWIEVSINIENLSTIELILGKIKNASLSANEALYAANKWHSPRYHSYRIGALCWRGYVYFQAGKCVSAYRDFIRAKKQFGILYPIDGFRYSTFLFAINRWSDARHSSTHSLQLAEMEGNPLDIALDKLVLGHSYVQEIVEGIIHKSIPIPKNMQLEMLIPSFEYKIQDDEVFMVMSWLNSAIELFHVSGQQEFLPYGLLVRASICRWLIYRKDGALEYGLSDLKEVYEIANRGDMKLFLCDYHLESARFALTINDEVLGLNANQHIQKARELIDIVEYNRRIPEWEYLNFEVSN